MLLVSHYVNWPKYHKLSKRHIVYHPAVTAVSIPVAMVMPNFWSNNYFDVLNNPDLNMEVLILMVEIVNLWLQNREFCVVYGLLRIIVKAQDFRFRYQNCHKGISITMATFLAMP